jgi:hypothetical protein
MKQTSAALWVASLMVLYYVIVFGGGRQQSVDVPAIEYTQSPGNEISLEVNDSLQEPFIKYSDLRCHMRFPLSEGDCGDFLGVYYDGWKNECVVLTGCSLSGVAAFNTSLKDPLGDCISSCVIL